MTGTGNRIFTEQNIYDVNFNCSFSTVLNNNKRSKIVVIYEINDDADIFILHNINPFANQIIFLIGTDPKSVSFGDFDNHN